MNGVTEDEYWESLLHVMESSEAQADAAGATLRLTLEVDDVQAQLRELQQRLRQTEGRLQVAKADECRARETLNSVEARHTALSALLFPLEQLEEQLLMEVLGRAQEVISMHVLCCTAKWLQRAILAAQNTRPPLLRRPKVLWAIGGRGPFSTLKSTEQFLVGGWRPGPKMQLPRVGAAAVAIADAIWVIGGSQPSKGAIFASTERYRAGVEVRIVVIPVHHTPCIPSCSDCADT